MAKKPLTKVAYRVSRPPPDRFLTFMVVLTQRTFKWTVRRKSVFWAIGVAVGIVAVAVIGSSYGLWATKKIMDFGNLQLETKQQQEQLRESMEQADNLQQALNDLYVLVEDLMKQVAPRSSSPSGNTVGSELKDNNESIGSHPKVSELKNELAQADERLKKLQARMAPVFSRVNETPSVPPTSGFISSPFGWRIHPFARTNTDDTGLTSFHSGMDISNKLGTPIQATANGTVTFNGWMENYGLTVIIRHSSEYETLYAHLQRAYVRVGQKVERGEIIAAMGRTGRATGPHLHYEVKRHGHAINPRPYLRLQSQWLADLK